MLKVMATVMGMMALLFAGQAKAYMDDGTPYSIQVGDRCGVAGAITTGHNPTTSEVVTLLCQCSPGIGDVCLWVQISYLYTSTTRPEGHTREVIIIGDGWAWGSEDAVGFAVGDGGIECTRYTQGMILEYANIPTQYCSNSGDPLNGPFRWVNL